MRKFFSTWNPEMSYIVEDSRNVSIALIFAGVVGFFLKEVEIANTAMILLIGLALWAFAIKKR